MVKGLAALQRPGFSSQLLHGSSWLSVTPGPGGPVLSSGLLWHQEHKGCVDRCEGTTLRHTK